ncbi:hypothetical protein [Acetobacter aceti]|uniref:hypothetical protein n=1 Tax=Acetobacter aceti TaxID=435 RepID=UPI0011AF2634|nr:hypothetical protein [Acetobacter aceti]
MTTVLITDAGTGFGHEVSLRMAEKALMSLLAWKLLHKSTCFQKKPENRGISARQETRCDQRWVSAKD